MAIGILGEIKGRVALAALLRRSRNLDRRYLEWGYRPERMEEGEALYGWRDALALTGDVDVACALVDSCSWQHPETLLEEWEIEGSVERAGGRYRIVSEDGSRAMCPKCGGRLLASGVPGYRYQCFCCDEDFYGIEAVYSG